jgi:hypothetical protein
MPRTTTTERVPALITLDTIEPREVKWLWYPYIPMGTITALFGMGGQGKSYLTVDLAARLSSGRPLPGGPQPSAPSNILMLSAEDDYPAVLVPRLIRQGADRSHIAVPDFQFTLDKKGAGIISEFMHDFAATVVFIDPIVYYAGGKMDMNRSNEVREMMERLKTAAEASESAVIIVGHVKKSEEGADQGRMMGSADWVNAARSGLLATITPDGTHIMKHVKTNYAARGPSWSYEIGDGGFQWIDEYDETELLPITSAKPKEKAIAFLKNLLKDGPVPSKEVEDRAKDEEIAIATLNRAKPGLAESYYSRSEGWMWRLLTERPVMGGKWD